MRDGGVPFLPPEQGVSEVSPRARETTMFQGEVALPLPVAEEGSESARQAPVFYEGASPDGKYAGANEKCGPCRRAMKSRVPQESIAHTFDSHSTSGGLAAAVLSV